MAQYTRRALEAQRDELLAACKTARHYIFLPIVTHPHYDMVAADINRIDVAIAKAEEGE